ncbi:MAG TPA: protein kinase [Verrucomicrobiae bacterium]|nr:protein kinase [Verrucomicrobiae bacterium]
MTADELARFRQIESAFHSALDRPEGAERDSFVEAAGWEDPTLAIELRQLLDAHARVEENVPSKSAPLPRFGAWQATRVLGHGGMGTVYLAERADGAFQMSAAVKVVPLALASPEIEDRFRRERQFLAMLDHPRIARLLDGGVSKDGLPYLVMEFVDGQTIDVYCDQHHLDTRDRVRLMRQVLEALMYVHSRQVIHRDIKPSNILVDEAEQPRLLDFGTARLVAPGSADAATRHLALTPHYASPEQARGETPTAASDIYSAGVLLYRLLTGRLPYHFKEISPASVAAVISGAEIDPPNLDPRLNAILLKAMAKDPAARYQSAAAMAADLSAYLEDRPVAARARGAARLQRSRLLAAVAIAAVVAAAVLFLAPGIFHTRQDPSIAVLPFVDLTGAPENRYFSEGLTDEITDELTRVKGLRVTARSSAFQFKGKTEDIREIGRRLGVAHVLEASVTRSADRVRIVAHLERVADNSLEWSHSYDSPAAGLSTAQSAMVDAIARALQTTSGNPARHVPNEEAHRLFMEGRYELQQATSDSVARAENAFRKAIEIDPQYAAVYAGLAGAVRSEDRVSAGTRRNESERQIGEEYLRKALELDPELPQALALQATFAMQYDWDWDRAEALLKRALAAGSGVTAESAYAFLLAFQHRFAEAEEHLRRAQDLDPFGTATLHDVATVRNFEGRIAEARELWTRVAALAPAMIGPKITIMMTYVEDNQTDVVLREAPKYQAQFPPEVFLVAMAKARQGKPEEARKLIEPFESRYPNTNVTTQWFALVYAFIGDEAATVKWLERSADRREFQALNLAVHPAYASMENSPGFLALKKRMGLDR